MHDDPPPASSPSTLVAIALAAIIALALISGVIYAFPLPVDNY